MLCPGRRPCLKIALLFLNCWLLHVWRIVLGLLLLRGWLIRLVCHSPLWVLRNGLGLALLSFHLYALHA